MFNIPTVKFCLRKPSSCASQYNQDLWCFTINYEWFLLCWRVRFLSFVSLMWGTFRKISLIPQIQFHNRKLRESKQKELFNALEECETVEEHRLWRLVCVIKFDKCISSSVTWPEAFFLWLEWVSGASEMQSRKWIDVFGVK